MQYLKLAKPIDLDVVKELVKSGNDIQHIDN